MEQPPAPVLDQQHPQRPQAGESLRIEAFELLEQRRWSEAFRVAESLRRLRPDDLEADVILTIAGANRPWRKTGGAAASRLKTRLNEQNDATIAESNLDDPAQALGWSALSSHYLAHNNYRAADDAARHTIRLAPDSPDGWWQLGASFAGLGWFDEAEDCIANARSRADMPSGAPLARWQIGRASNRWAMSQTPAIWLAALLWFFVGLLALAAVITTPFLMRELRMSRLDGDVRAMAEEEWASQSRRRFTAAGAVLVIVALWVIGLMYLGPAAR